MLPSFSADYGNNRVRMLYGSSLSTLAGTGAYGSKDGLGSSATFKGPLGVTLDGTGTTLFVTGESRVESDLPEQ